MKKRIISAIAVLAFVFGTAVLPQAHAQVFLINEEEEIGSLRLNGDEAAFPNVPLQNITYDQLAPVGEGLLLLTALGGFYLIGKKRKEQ